MNETQTKMKKQLLLFLCLMLSPFIYAQNIIGQAAKEPTPNQNGDPVNNIIDPDGSRQGDWFYIDRQSRDVIKQTYQNNELKETFISINNEWVNVSDLKANESIKNELLNVLKANEIEIESHQQIVITKDKNKIQIYGLGQWSDEKFKNCTEKLMVYLEQNSTKISQPTYIIL